MPTPISEIIPTPVGFGCATGLHCKFQTVSFVLIRGFEFQVEADFPMGKFCSFSPYFSFSTIKITNKRPYQNRVTIVQNLYNSNAPLELDGSPSDGSFYSLPNYQGAFTARFTDSKGNSWSEY